MTDAEEDNSHDCPCGGICPGPNHTLLHVLRLRTAAMHRVGRTNDHLRALLANQENQ